MAESRRKPTRRSYRPRLEALEALRLLDAGLVPSAFSPAAEWGASPFPDESPLSDAARQAAWDAALDESEVSRLLAQDGPRIATRAISAPNHGAEPDSVRCGLDQLTRYLGRAWARAGIEPQYFEDCTQEVYETLLRQLGRDGFENLADNVGRYGVRTVLNRETPDGPDFFRAVDMVKKRTQRIKSFQSLDEHFSEVADAAGGDGASAGDWRRELDEAIERSLTAREAALIRKTMMGMSPQEIAADWGVAPKTVSNEKTRALHKLRACLSPELAEV